MKYILRRFSEYHDYKYSVDYDDLTIEHIHPQSEMNEEWSEKFIGCLGNLILLEPKLNEELNTKNFADKKSILLERNHTLPNFIKHSVYWAPEIVTSHTEQMAEEAYQDIWKI